MGYEKARATRSFLLHCRKAVQIAYGKPPDPLPKIWYNPSVTEAKKVFKSWKDGFAVDIETISLDDRRMQSVAASGDWSEAMVWSLVDSRILKRLGPLKRELAGPKRKVFQNGDFDVPILRGAGYVIPNETIWDTMIENQLMFPDEPVNLSYLTSLVTDVEAWKHLRPEGGKTLLFYNALDACYDWRVYVGAEESYKEFEQ